MQWRRRRQWKEALGFQWLCRALSSSYTHVNSAVESRPILSKRPQFVSCAREDVTDKRWTSLWQSISPVSANSKQGTGRLGLATTNAKPNRHEAKNRKSKLLKVR